MHTAKSADLLRTLIEVNNNSIAGYEASLKETAEADLKMLFKQFKQKSQACKTELIYELRQLDKTLMDGTEPAGTSHRAWLDYKGPLTGKDRTTMLNACEYIERVAANAYQEVLENNPDTFTAEQKTMLFRQHALILENLEALKILQDVLQEQS